MKRACIAIVDAAHARLFTYEEQTADPTQQLREIQDLVNPGRRLRPSELFSETRPGLGSQPGRNASHGTGSAKDDHRDDHIEMMDAKFAKQVVGEIERIVSAEKHVHVIVAASPKMLGELRKADVLRQPGLRLDEIARDLTKLTSAQIHDHLAELQLIPPRERLTITR